MNRSRLSRRAAGAALLLSAVLTALPWIGCGSDRTTFRPQASQPLAPGASGAWQDLGLTSGFVEVQALTTWNGRLIAGGTFFGVQGSPSTSLASWDGTSWTRLGPDFGGGVYALTTWNGHLIVGGGFTNVNGDAIRGVGDWDGSKWRALGSGLDRSVSALSVYNGDLIAGGSFDSAGGVPAAYVARWDGASWHPLGGGLNGVPWALAVYHGQLIAGGAFSRADGAPASGIAAWNGTAWSPLGAGVRSGSTVDPFGIVYALSVHGDSLIAGGAFVTAGGVFANHVAKWDGTQWLPLGPGVGEFTDEVAKALADYGDTLVVGGAFPGNVKRWDGSGWKAMSSLNGFVSALTEYDGYLIAGGYFPKDATQPANGLARWGK